MRSRLRSLDSKISFFAFADIITAVSGVLIFVALLLATDLGKPSNSSSDVANSETAQRLKAVLAQQLETDSQNHSLAELLASAETAPAAEKLELDITRLRAALTDEQKKHARVAEQLAASQSSMEARDRTLGLADLKVQIQRMIQEMESLAREDRKVREQMAGLEQRVANIQSRLLKLRQREGKIWLIPDKSSTTKEPILATVSGSGLKVERFDHPEKSKEFSKSSADSEFTDFLATSKQQDEYIVFLVRPSGIGLFEKLVKMARDKGFDVGFDALEEGREIHFTTPPSLDETPLPSTNSDTAYNSTATNSTTTNAPQSHANASTVATPRADTTPPGALPANKSWWRRFLELIGLDKT